jgi:hypothetical protein
MLMIWRRLNAPTNDEGFALGKLLSLINQIILLTNSMNITWPQSREPEKPFSSESVRSSRNLVGRLVFVAKKEFLSSNKDATAMSIETQHGIPNHVEKVHGEDAQS